MAGNQELITDPAYTGEAPISSGRFESIAEESNDPRIGRWPRMIKLDEDTEMRLKLWLDHELDAFFAERQEMLRNWRKWHNQYWAEPSSEVRNFPFKKAANIVVPLTAIAVEAIHARLMTTLFSVEPFWSIRPRSASWIEVAKPMERYLQAEAENPDSLNVYGFCNEALMEFIKLGTVVGKAGYKRDFKKGLRKSLDAEGSPDEEEFFVETYNGATLEHVHLPNFIMRFVDIDPQTARLVGERHRFTWARLKKMAQVGRLDKKAVEKVKHFWNDINATDDPNDGQDVIREVQQLADAEPMWVSKFDVDEIWCAFDVDGDGYDEEIVIDYHKQSSTILSIRYNWYEDLHRPYRVAQYIPIEGVWTGIGVGKQNEQFQEEVTTIHRQRLDNATLANMTMIVLKKNSGYGPGEPIFPGKMWFMDDVDDIREFKVSEIYASSYNNEEAVKMYSDRRVGVNDAILGAPQQGTPATATSDIARLAEGTKRFDLVLKNVRRMMSSLGADIIVNYQQFGNQEVHWLLEEDKGRFVEAVLRMPATLVRRGAVIDLSVTDSITNREVEQQKWLSLFQVITGHYDKVLERAMLIAQMTGDPSALVELAAQGLMKSNLAMSELLDTFTVPAPERFDLILPGEEEGNGSTQSAAARSEGGLIGPGAEAGVQGSNEDTSGGGAGPSLGLEVI